MIQQLFSQRRGWRLNAALDSRYVSRVGANRSSDEFKRLLCGFAGALKGGHIRQLFPVGTSQAAVLIDAPLLRTRRQLLFCETPDLRIPTAELPVEKLRRHEITPIGRLQDGLLFRLGFPWLCSLKNRLQANLAINQAEGQANLAMHSTRSPCIL